MKKIIALNWKDSQTFESAQELISVISDIALMYNEYECVLFPGDSLLPQIEESDIILGTQDYNPDFAFPYSIVGHMSRRKKGETDLEIR